MKTCKLTLLLLVLSTTTLLAKGYKITVDVKGAADSTALLAFYSGENKYALDTIILDSKGHGVFTKPKSLDGGMYLIIIGRMALCDVLIADDKSQTFSISTELSKPFEQLKFTNSPENEAFTAYLRYKNSAIDKQEKIKKQQQANPSKEQADSLNAQAQLVRSGLSRYSDSIAAQYPKQMLAVVVNALNIPEPPQLNIPKDDPKYDSLLFTYYYKYEEEHFFDRMDLSDDRITRTPFFQSLLYYYFDKLLLNQQADSLIPHVDRVIAMSNGNEFMFRYLLSSLFNHYMASKIMGQEGVTVHLAEAYYLSGKASWESDKFRKELSDFVKRTKPTLLGNQAPALTVETLTGQQLSLSDIDASYLILFFYEPSCSHCQAETPKVFQTYQKFKDKGIKALAIYIQQDKKEWVDFVAEKGLDWINVWAPHGTDNLRDTYNLYTTPQLYLLDKDKKIIGLRLDAETLDKMLTHLTKEKNK